MRKLLLFAASAFAASVFLCRPGLALPLSASGLMPESVTEIAARPDAPPEEAPASEDKMKFRPGGQMVLDMQQALADMGFYLGPIDGNLDAETEAAIRVYQQNTGLEPDGKITAKLHALLTDTVEVRTLLKRLGRIQKSGKEKARQALLAHPATRDLVNGKAAPKPDPERSPDETASRCYTSPHGSLPA